MRAVIQRSQAASVAVDGQIIGAIERGLVVLLGIGPHDGPKEVQWLAEKIANLRIFADVDDKMNLSLLDVGGQALVISQFTLYGDCRKGRRPNFTAAAPPSMAEPLYEQFCEKLREIGVLQVETGSFGAMMQVSLINDGPVTLVIDTKSKAGGK